ncbi:MAG: radical SAM/SPASM domain-containing protein [Bacteroidetes bacterium]|nr:radical SAM/SPASM domain-containing protein [Bacteroidota bacterium]
MILLLKRGINLIKIVKSYLISRITKRVIHWGNPLAVSIEPNNSCNLQCPECPAGMKELTRPRGFMEPALFRSIINQLLPHLSYLTLYFQGEPFMSKHFFDFISYATSKKIFVATSTNGHFLDAATVQKTIASGLNRLIISLDGADQQSYEAYRRGGDFNKVITGIRLLVSEKKRLKKQTPQVVLQCLVLSSNEHHLDEIRKMAKELGADKLEFKTAQFNDFEHGNPLMPETTKYSRYKPPAHPLTRSPVHQFTPKNRMPDSCFRMWSSCVVTWDGLVVPCCFDKDATHVMGDLTKQGFRDIWRGTRYNDFRKKILRNRKSVGICGNCSQNF